MNKNHEGYHDPTASKAIRRANRKRMRKAKRERLTYKFSEVQGFSIVKRMMLR